MNRTKLSLVVSLCLATGLWAADSETWPRRPLNNEGIVMLARSGYQERFLLDLMKTQECRFDTSVEGLVYFAKNGISERLVRAMLASEAAQRERQNGGEDQEQASPAAPRPAAVPSPVRLRVVKQRVLVPDRANTPVPAHGMLLVEPRMLGDRWWLLPSTSTHTSQVLAASGR